MAKRIVWILIILLLLCAVPALAYVDSVTGDQVVDYLEDRLGESYQADMCLLFVKEVWADLGFEPMGSYGSAAGYWNYLKNNNRAHTSKNDIPIGADVFFSGGEYGHVGIHVGDGDIIHARTSSGVCRIAKNNIYDDNWYSTNYLGWAWNDNVTVDNGPVPPRKKVLSGVYVIHSAWNDNYCLDIQGNSKENNANIQLYHRVYDDVQKFRIINWGNGYYCIQSIYNGLWLDIAHPIENRANVKLYENNSADENDWYFEDAGDGYVYIRSRTGYYLDIALDAVEDNANIQVYSRPENNSQRWRLEDVTDYYNLENGVYTVSTARNNDYRLDIYENSRENRANIQLYRELDTPVQFFRFTKKGGYYVVQSVYAGKWLDIHLDENGNVGDKSNVQLWESNTSDEEHWVLENAGNGYVYMRSNADYYLDVEGDTAKNNANIQVYHFMNNDSQRWRIERVEHRVDFDANGGTNPPVAQTKIYEQTLTLSAVNPTREGYDFQGWATSANATTAAYQPGDSYSVDADITLYAVWRVPEPDLVLPADLISIESEAFAGSAFVYAALPDGCAAIGSRAFADCPNLRHIDIPEGCTAIAADAFSGVSQDMTIHGVRDSYAEFYAERGGFRFEAEE